MTDIDDNGADLGMDEPFIRWSVIVTYPADRGGLHAGTTTRIRTNDEWHALRARSSHLGNGATYADIQRQVWSPADWETVDPPP